MSLKNIKDGDVFFNTLKTEPRFSFIFYEQNIYEETSSRKTGSFSNNIKHVPNGFISLYELNIDRPSDSLIYPFFIKNSQNSYFSNVSIEQYNQLQYGSTITGSYPMSSSISKVYYTSDNTNRPYIKALKNILNSNRIYSEHFSYSSSLGHKEEQELGIVSIPSIFYGSEIKKGSVELEFNISGSTKGLLRDFKKNGELIETSGSFSGSIAGIVLYKQGLIILTGSWPIDGGHSEEYVVGNETPKWRHFAQSISGTISTPSSSFGLTYSGIEYINKKTFLTSLPKDEFNYSNNKTYKSNSSVLANYDFYSSSYEYVENPKIEIKNIVSSSFSNHSASFDKTTYVSSVLLYDENKEVIAVAKLATPLRKTKDKEFLIKLEIDLF